jgi:hypothetical protein
MVYALQKFMTLLTGKTFQYVYRSFNSQIPRQKASVGGGGEFVDGYCCSRNLTLK